MKSQTTPLKTMVITLACVLVLSGTPVRAVDGGLVAADTLIVRPVCLAATVIGSALFIVSLPIAAISKSIKPAAHALVVAPARATFTRPLGDFDDFDYSED